MATYKRIKTEKKKYPIRQCKQCGDDYLPKAEHQIYCQSLCRIAAWHFKRFVVPGKPGDK